MCAQTDSITTNVCVSTSSPVIFCHDGLYMVHWFYSSIDPKGFVGLILGTINPLTIDIDAENQWVYSFSCQS